MKRPAMPAIRFVVSGMRLLFCLLAAWPLFSQSPVDEVRKAEAAMAAARVAKDVAAMDRLTASDFLWVRAGGAVTDKKALLEEMREGTLDAYESVGEDRVRVYGNTAVVIAARILHESKGDVRIAVTNVWVKSRDGAWQRVSSHTTRIVQPPR
jgi:ketosteroid isomerase-like protein